MPNGPGAQALFGALGPTAASTIELATPVELNRLQMGGGQSITLSGAGPLNFTAAGSVLPELSNLVQATIKISTPTRIDASELQVNPVSTTSLATIEFLGPLSGSGKVVKQGLGTLAISGSTADLAADIEIESGIVLANSAALASTNNRIVVGPAGRLVIPSSTSTAVAKKPLALGGGVLELRGSSGSSRLTLEGAIALSGTSTLSVTQSLAGATLAGPISGAGGVKYTSTSTLTNRTLLTISGDNIYDGLTEIDIGPRSTFRGVVVSSANGLGSSVGATIVRSSVTILEASAEAFVVEPTGWLLLTPDEEFHSGDITLKGSILHPAQQFSNDEGLTTKISGDILLAGGGQIGLSPYSSSPLEHTGDLRGSGSLIVGGGGPQRYLGNIQLAGNLILGDRGELELRGAVNIGGDLILSKGNQEGPASGRATWAATNAQFGNDVLLRDRPLNVLTNLQVEDLRLDSRRVGMRAGLLSAALEIDPTATVEVLGDFAFRGGSLRGRLTGVPELRKTTAMNGSLGRLDDSFTGGIFVEEGVLVLEDSRAAGEAAGGVHATSRDRAVVVLNQIATIADDVFLNNARGYNYSGGLAGPGTLTGDLYLGDVGSYVGGDSGDSSGLPASFGGDLKLAGKIHGGALRKTGYDTLNILAGGHTYTGPTEVLNGTLALAEQGRLDSTAEVRLQRTNYSRPQLLLDNRVANLSDRLADDVTIRTRDSGQVTLQGAESAPTQETIGALILDGGHSRVRVTPGAGTELTTLTLNSFSRMKGATAHIMLDNNRARLLLPGQPLDDGLIPWAVVGGDRFDLPTDFATISAGSVAPYSSVFTYETDLNAAARDSNVKLSESTSLTADRSINALAIGRGSSSEVNLNLNGHKLVLKSGALLASEAFLNVQNGALTSQFGELLLHTYYDPRFQANLVDNGATSVAVTFAGRGNSRVSGINTYTGGTTVSGLAQLLVEGSQSLPEGGDLTLSDGTVMLADAADGVWNIGTLRMRGDTLTRLNQQSTGTIDATEYLLESGIIEVPLSGAGTLRKQGIGRVSLDQSNPNYRGQIVIEQGALVVQRADSLGGGTIDEARATIVKSGGALIANGTYANELLILDGGDLSVWQGGSQGVWSGPIEVRAPSRILPYSPNSASIISGPLRGTGELTISGVFDDSSITATSLTGSLNQFQGNLKITGGNVTLSGNNSAYAGQFIVDATNFSVAQSAALGSAKVTVLEAGRFNPTASLTANVDIQGGTLGVGASNVVLTGQLRLAREVTVDTSGLELGFDVAARNATIRSRTTLVPNTQVKKFGRGNLRFEGETLLEGSAEFIAWEGRFDVAGKLIAGAGATTVRLTGAGASLGAALEVRQGSQLSVLRDEQPASLTVLGIAGGGTIGASLTLAPNSTIAPGDSPGTLRVDGDLRLGTNTTYNWELGNSELGSLANPANCDLLSLTGALDFGVEGQSLLVRLLNTPALAELDRHLQAENLLSREWKFISAGSVLNFAPGKISVDKSLTNLAGRFALRQAGAEFYLAYTIPEAGACFLALQALGATLFLRWIRPNLNVPELRNL